MKAVSMGSVAHAQNEGYTKSIINAGVKMP
jgi:hypothetical protein